MNSPIRCLVCLEDMLDIQDLESRLNALSKENPSELQALELTVSKNVARWINFSDFPVSIPDSPDEDMFPCEHGKRIVFGLRNPKQLQSLAHGMPEKSRKKAISLIRKVSHKDETIIDCASRVGLRSDESYKLYQAFGILDNKPSFEDIVYYNDRDGLWEEYPSPETLRDIDNSPEQYALIWLYLNN